MLLSMGWDACEYIGGEGMRGLSGLLCAVLIALSPVRASAFDWKDSKRVDWRRFVLQQACGLILGRASKYGEELMVAAETGKRFGCPLLVDKVLGSAPRDKNASRESKLLLGSDLLDEECHKDLDCPGTKCVVSSVLPDPDDPTKGNCAAHPLILFGPTDPSFNPSPALGSLLPIDCSRVDCFGMIDPNTEKDR
jgi:hypothetical protein